METPLVIALACASGVLFICLIILLAYCCYRKYKQNQYEKEDLEESTGVENNVISTPNIIMTRKDRTEDLFTGKRMPFGVHSSMTNIPDEVEKEDQDRNFDRNTLQPNGFKPQYNSSFLSVRQNSTKSNAPSFSEHAGDDNCSIHY